MGKVRTDERIKIVNGYDKDSYTYIPVIIIGAGESGIATACKLKSDLGFDQFRCYDRQSGFGGTWWINRYPGVVSRSSATRLLVWLNCSMHFNVAGFNSLGDEAKA